MAKMKAAHVRYLIDFCHASREDAGFRIQDLRFISWRNECEITIPSHAAESFIICCLSQDGGSKRPSNFIFSDMADLDLKSVDRQKNAELQSPTQYDEAAETRVRRKLDRHLMPLFFVLCE